MKNKILFYILIISMLGAACKKLNPVEGIDFQINTNFNKSPLLIQFVNANPEAQRQPLDSVGIKVTGKDASLVLMNDGDTKIRASQGFLQLVVANTKTPSAVNPVDFTISASFPGFLPVEYSFHLTDTTPKAQVIYLYEIANPVSGTGNISTTFNISASNSTTVRTLPAKNMFEKASLTIPAGTVLYNEAGAAIPSNQVSLDLVHLGATDENSINAFPGGLQTRNAVSPNGTAVDSVVDFITAGCVKINMVAGGQNVKSFSKPIVAELEIADNFYDFYRGRNLQPGDSIPIWSMDEGTAKWVIEGLAPVYTNASGKLAAKFDVNHLSWWNLDYWQQARSFYHWFGWWRWFYSPPACNNSNLRINVTTINVPYTGYVSLAITSNGQYLGSGAGYMQNGLLTSNLNLSNRIFIPNAKIRATIYRDFQVISAETPNFSPCSQPSVNLNINIPPPPDMVNLSVRLFGKCTNKNIQLNYSGWVFVREKNAVFGNWVYVWSGSPAYFPRLKNNATYIFSSWNGGWSSVEVPIRKESAAALGNMPIRNGIKASAIYNNSTNTLEVTGSFEVKCQ